MLFKNIVIVIPAYNPDKELIRLVKTLKEYGFQNIVIVNDGSKEEFDLVFNEIEQNEAILIKNRTNEGKGQSLKIAFKYVLNKYNANDIFGVITVDADGQHLVKDVIKVADKFLLNKRSLVLGSRKFDEKVPFRSKFGNLLTRYIFNLFTGMLIQDTQTGLRAISYDHLSNLLKIHSKRYEFELEMLITFCLNKKIKFEEVLIETVYIDDNSSSHFNPVKDSIKIYSVFIRYFFYCFKKRF